MLIIGEVINGSNKAVKEAVMKRNDEFIKELAHRQVQSGADYIDVNVGVGKGDREQEIADMQWAVLAIQEVVDKPLALDTTDPYVLEAGLKVHRGQAMINSVSAESERMDAFFTLAREFGAKAVALPITDKGIPATPREKLGVIEYLINQSLKNRVKPKELYFDPLALPVSVEADSGANVLQTLAMIKEIPEVKTTVGLSNISYGMPVRELLNQSFLLLAMQNLDAVILNPLDKSLRGALVAGAALLGRDRLCMDYIRAYRRGELS
ncbi:dihydropteroate synthase [Dethiobacter alkaliphilus]|uniref:dihydropteroate synthase n=1 Tax=Dethiobacter alkaliphilus TaxID=427926 RepID=UPI0022272AA5|nr:dihydropteroate synthase [Dethiobacter alkaliphilus]MCW3490974.1 dihydropteroate synthase [Dethiobacter alkaliphilus]